MNVTSPVVMSENIMMGKITHFSGILCAIFATSMCNSYFLTTQNISNAKNCAFSMENMHVFLI